MSHLQRGVRTISGTRPNLVKSSLLFHWGCITLSALALAFAWKVLNGGGSKTPYGVRRYWEEGAGSADCWVSNCPLPTSPVTLFQVEASHWGCTSGFHGSITIHGSVLPAAAVSALTICQLPEEEEGACSTSVLSRGGVRGAVSLSHVVWFQLLFQVPPWRADGC